MQENAQGVLEVLIDQVAVDRRTITVSGLIFPGRTDEWIAHIEAMQAADHFKPIAIYIDSEGGDANGAVAMYEVLRRLDAEGTPTVGVVYGCCESAAPIILAGCSHREAFANARFVLHNPQPLIVAESAGSVEDLLQTAEFQQLLVERLQNCHQLGLRFCEIMVERTKLSGIGYALLSTQQAWFNAWEAQRIGLIHRIC